MRLVIDVAEEYKNLFLEAAKATKATVQIDEQYVNEEHDETEFLLRNPRNRERLMESIKNVEEGKLIEVDEKYLDDALLGLIEEGKEEGRMTAKEQSDFKTWLFT